MIVIQQTTKIGQSMFWTAMVMEENDLFSFVPPFPDIDRERRFVFAKKIG
jgi:hypothetical protein